ncbi:MAG: flagellar export chaperone FliS [Actinobacteria bacterium]|nr:flagellar export chaperone FliS [Actinomycetota bacterium]
MTYGREYGRNASANVRYLRERYLRDAILTATPAQRVVMLYDQLLLDITTATSLLVVEGIRDLKGVNDHLVNAQEIVLTLRDVLRTDLWEGAANLAQLYTYIHGELVQANLQKDVERLRGVVELVERLADAFRTAASGEDGSLGGSHDTGTTPDTPAPVPAVASGG